MSHPSIVARLAPFALALGIVVAAPDVGSAQAPAQPAPAATSEVKDLPLTSAERQKYLGSYTIAIPDGSRLVLRIYEEDGKLMGKPEGDDDEPSRILYQGDHTFRPEANTAMLVSFTVVGDRATKLTVSREGMAMEGLRNP